MHGCWIVLVDWSKRPVFLFVFAWWVLTPRWKSKWRCWNDVKFFFFEGAQGYVIKLCFLHDVFFRLIVVLVTRCRRIFKGRLLWKRFMFSFHCQIHCMSSMSNWRMRERGKICQRICNENVCSHCRTFYVLTPRSEKGGEWILPDVEFGTMEVK